MPYFGPNSASPMSELLRRSISNAACDDRLKIGLDNCVEHLYSCDPYKVLAVALTDSSTDIITQTILETFCYEHKIPFLKIDSNTLVRYLKPAYFKKISLSNIQNSTSTYDTCCVLIARPDNFANFPDEIALVNLISESESNNETYVILNSSNTSDTVSTNAGGRASNVTNWREIT